MAMTCPQCGANDVVENSTFCHRCGERMETTNALDTASVPDNSREGKISPVQRSEVLGDGDIPPASNSDAFTPPRQPAPTSAVDDDYNRILWSTHYSMKAEAGWFFVVFIVSIALISLSVYFQWWSSYWMYLIGVLGLWWIWTYSAAQCRRMALKYELTPSILTHEEIELPPKGFFKRKINRVEVVDIRDIHVDKGFFEGIFGVGTITVLSSDPSDETLKLRGMPDVVENYKILEKARHKEHTARGVELL